MATRRKYPTTVLLLGIYFVGGALFQGHQSRKIAEYIMVNQHPIRDTSAEPPVSQKLKEPRMRVVLDDLSWYTSESERTTTGGRPLQAREVGWEDDWMTKWKRKNYDPTERLECTMSKPSPYQFGRLCTVPAYIPARIPRKNAKRIPRVIFLSWRKRQLGPSIYTSIKTLLHNNPEYELVFFTDHDIDRFMCENYPQGNNSITDGFSRLNAGAARADVWRMMVIGRYGGVYLDIDEAALAPLPIDNDFDSVVSGVGWWNSLPVKIPGLLEHWALAYSPRHPVILRTIDNIRDNLRIAEKFEKGGEFWMDDPTYSFTIAVTGPTPYQKALHEVLQRIGCRTRVNPSSGLESYEETLKDPKQYCGKNYPRFLEVFGNFKATFDIELNQTLKAKLLYPDDELVVMDKTWVYDSYALNPVDPGFCKRQNLAKRDKANQVLWEKSIWKRTHPHQSDDIFFKNYANKSGYNNKDASDDSGHAGSGDGNDGDGDGDGSGDGDDDGSGDGDDDGSGDGSGDGDDDTEKEKESNHSNDGNKDTSTRDGEITPKPEKEDK